MGRSLRGRHRVSRIDVLLQDVCRPIKNDKSFERTVFVAFVDQERFGVPTPTIGNRLLYIHVDFVSDTLPSLHRQINVRIGSERYPQYILSEYIKLGNGIVL